MTRRGRSLAKRGTRKFTKRGVLGTIAGIFVAGVTYLMIAR